MNQINAFVGHSFSERDETLVATFLKYFAVVSSRDPSFSFETAEAAEPRLLADKIMSVIADKNVFIGICTKKELVVDADPLCNVLWQPTYHKVKEEVLCWKTSDWLIQEIGLAKGRGMDLVLLIEEGVRPPGGLQGDIEYISFNRDAPDRSFLKILEMLKPLAPKTSDELLTSHQSGSLTSTSDRQLPSSSQTDYLITPTPLWTQRNYKIAIIEMMMRADTAGVETINNAYMATAEAKDEYNRIAWEAHVEYSRLTFGKGGNLNRLRALAAGHPNNSRAIELLAIVLSRYDEYHNSAKQYEAASCVALDSDDKNRLMGRAAEGYAHAGEMEQVTEIINRIRADFNAN